MAYKLEIESYSEYMHLDKRKALLLLDLVKEGVENHSNPSDIDEAIELRDALEGIIDRGISNWKIEHI